jgi:C1A family cysteine protease
MKAAALLLVFLAVAFAYDEAITRPLFQEFKAKYGKVYLPMEEEHRFVIFSQNFDRAAELSRQGNNVYGVTKFSDLDPVEFQQKYLGRISRSAHKRAGLTQLEDVPVPTSFDWNTKGAVTPVKNQEQCGSCWAFSVAEAVESAWFLAKNTLPVLSPQQIVDCDTVDQGCNGGDPPTAYQYLMKQGGLDTEASYPYTGEDGTCAYKAASSGAKISNWAYITQNLNESQVQQGLLQKGPLSICVDASSWQFYLGGVVTDLCPSATGDLDHCVMLTGYNEKYSDWNGIVYDIWIVRNSWGADWGEDGYIYVERGYNLCGIADEVTIPII